MGKYTLGEPTNLIDLHDDWGMADRSDEWKRLEVQLRELHCKEYGHSYFPGPPYSWKEFCRSCGENPQLDK